MSQELSSPIFLRWAGGKRWLLPILRQLVSERRFNRYIEPFLGGGALFLELGSQIADRYIISDIEYDLVRTFRAIKSDVDDVISKYSKWKPTKEEYYRVRSLPVNGDGNFLAARFVYLNRLAWNGLYRVNLKGKFNVPFAPKQIPVDFPDRLRLASRILKRSPGQILHSDFSEIIKNAGRGDFVLLDPPYVDKDVGTTPHRYYNKTLFTWNEQKKLAKMASAAVRRGAFVVVTQGRGAAESAFDGKPFRKLLVYRQQIIAAEKDSRKPTKETILISRNFTQ